MTTTYAPATPSRPLGVAILAVLLGIYGVLVAIGGVLLLASVAVVSFLGVSSSFGGLSHAVLGAIVLIIGLIILGVALGLWHLRLWALVLALLFTIIEVIVAALAGNFVSFAFIFGLILFVYLLAVSRHFY
jgi:uncharacterized membrane protein (DUF2068 family)